MNDEFFLISLVAIIAVVWIAGLIFGNRIRADEAADRKEKEDINTKYKKWFEGTLTDRDFFAEAKICHNFAGNQDDICEYCRKWMRYPRSRDACFGCCIEPENGFRYKYTGLLSKCIGQCPNYAPLTFAWMGCRRFERKINTEEEINQIPKQQLTAENAGNAEEKTL